jgi:hypothetical protein
MISSSLLSFQARRSRRKTPKANRILPRVERVESCWSGAGEDGTVARGCS